MGLKDGTKVYGNGLATNVVTSTTYLAGRKGGYRVGNGWGWCRVVGLCCGVKHESHFTNEPTSTILEPNMPTHTMTDC